MLAPEYRHEWTEIVTPGGLVVPKLRAGRRTSGSGVTGSPTPRGIDGSKGQRTMEGVNAELARKGNLDELPSVAMLAGHPTPSSEGSAGEISEDLERVGNKFRNRKTGRILQTNLATDALMLCGHPTPNCDDPNNATRDSGTYNSLTRTAQLAGHPTCSARDWKDTLGMAQTGTNPDGSERSRLDMLPRVSALALGANTASTATSTGKTGGYRLNPGFSLWLMVGIPSIVDAWASCGVRAMLSCRVLRRNS